MFVFHPKTWRAQMPAGAKFWLSERACMDANPELTPKQITRTIYHGPVTPEFIHDAPEAPQAAVPAPEAVPPTTPTEEPVKKTRKTKK